MQTTSVAYANLNQPLGWAEAVHELGPRFASRAATHDRDESFVSENYAELKERRLFAAAVPAELGGGGVSYRELCHMLRVLARSCGSTALALSMHTHQVAAAAWRWRNDGARVESLLQRVAKEQIVLVGSAFSDWLASSGVAEKVEGGYRVTARKTFASGVPVGDLLITSAVHDDPGAGPTVLHFAVPLRAADIRIVHTWRTLGMRGTGSHDVALDRIFVPEAAVTLRRPRGEWHRMFHIMAMIAFPLIYAVYTGIAEAACATALHVARDRRDSPDVPLLVGEMRNEMLAAQIALRTMIDTAVGAEPGPETTDAIFMGKTLVTRAVLRVAERALETTGGAGFYRNLGLERLYRDLQGARYHPLQEKAQLRYAGRMALGLGPAA